MILMSQFLLVSQNHIAVQTIPKQTILYKSNTYILHLYIYVTLTYY